MYDVIIVGGGAAGLVCAVALARKRSDLSIAVTEANDTFGKKIRISGNGKCNIGNRHVSPERYFCTNPDFVAQCLEGYDAARIETFLSTLGVIVTEASEGKLFPLGKQASFVAETLLYEAQTLGVTLRSSCRVENITSDSRGFNLTTDTGKIACRTLVLATGSPAAPQLGGNASGLHFARNLGHRIIDPLPSLVQLTVTPHPFKRAAGVRRHAAVTLFVNGDMRTVTRGDVLFTDYGVSGLAVLDISPHVSLALSEYAFCELEIDLFDTMSVQALRTFLASHIDTAKTTPATLVIGRFLPKKLGDAILRRLGWHETNESDFTRKRIHTLAYTLKHLRIDISGTRGFKGAEVALGGVDTRDIEPATMASKQQQNLYVIGEMLDVAGERGGFNFHFAFTSALRAAEAMAKG